MKQKPLYSLPYSCMLPLCYKKSHIKRTACPHAGYLFLSLHSICMFISVKSFQLSMSSCPDLKRFLKPFGIKRQIFWTPILQLAKNVIATMTRTQAFRLETRVCLRPPRTHASSSPYDNIGRRRWSLRTMSADIPSIQRRYHSKSES